MLTRRNRLFHVVLLAAVHPIALPTRYKKWQEAIRLRILVIGLYLTVFHVSVDSWEWHSVCFCY